MKEWKDLGLSSGFFIRQGPPVSLLEAFAFRLLFHTKDPVDEEGEETFFFLSSLRCCSSLSLAPDKTAIFFSPLSLAARDKQQTQRDGIITIRIDRRDEASSDIA